MCSSDACRPVCRTYVDFTSVNILARARVFSYRVISIFFSELTCIFNPEVATSRNFASVENRFTVSHLSAVIISIAQAIGVQPLNLFFVSLTMQYIDEKQLNDDDDDDDDDNDEVTINADKRPDQKTHQQFIILLIINTN